MKRIAIILLSISLLIFAAGCQENPSVPTTESPQTDPSQPEPTETTAETQPPAFIDLPLLAFSAPVKTHQYFADDGTLLFTYAYQDISLILEDPQIADTIVLDLLNQVDYENSAAKNILSDAKDAYTGQVDWVSYAYSTFFAPARFDSGILSLLGSHSLYSGSPRSTTTNVSITYDLISGRQLALKDILVSDFSADSLSQLITNSLSPLSAQGMLFSDYAYVVSELFTTNRPVESWYLSETGLCFYFAPYEIAPYSSGIITAEIPYSELTALLKDEYFPAEITELSGEPSIQQFDDATAGQFVRFAELVMEESGNRYILSTNGYLQDLRIELGSWTEDGNFLPEATVFTTPVLCGADGILIQMKPDTSYDLCITYIDNGEIKTLNLSDAIAGN